jgi:hypothetical protein
MEDDNPERESKILNLSRITHMKRAQILREITSFKSSEHVKLKCNIYLIGDEDEEDEEIEESERNRDQHNDISIFLRYITNDFSRFLRSFSDSEKYYFELSMLGREVTFIFYG